MLAPVTAEVGGENLKGVKDQELLSTKLPSI
jgi:hypothetical protein